MSCLLDYSCAWGGGREKGLCVHTEALTARFLFVKALQVVDALEQKIPPHDNMNAG